MEKSCANHPESMALATCKACDKSVCLMCVVDEKEGTFCSTECHSAFSSGQDVPKYAAAEPVAASAGVQKLDSIFDDEPAAAAPTSEGLPLPPSDEALPIVAEGTKWRSIGAQCDNHADTPAVANCDRCGKAVCALCLLEAAQGTFCSAECMATVVKQPATQPATAERAALQGRPVFHFKAAPKTFSNGQLTVAAVVIALLAGGGYYGWITLSPTVMPASVTPPPIVPDTARVTPVTPVAPNPTKTTTPDPVKTGPTKTDPIKKTTPPVKVDPVKTDPTTTTTPVIARPKPPPKPQPIYTRKINPWGNQELGVWYRTRIDRGGKIQYTDIGLKEKAADSYVLITQSSADGQASAATETKNPVLTVVLKGEETFRFEDRTYLCEIQAAGPEDNAATTWALLSGKSAGAVLKYVSAQGTMAARRIWEHTLRVKNRSFDCLVVESQTSGDGPTRVVKSWYCGALPMGVVQQEKEGELIEVVDFGSDWAKRPAFPAK